MKEKRARLGIEDADWMIAEHQLSASAGGAGRDDIVANIRNAAVAWLVPAAATAGLIASLCRRQGKGRPQRRMGFRRGLHAAAKRKNGVGGRCRA
jgi:hypothetical protein